MTTAADLINNRFVVVRTKHSPARPWSVEVSAAGGEFIGYLGHFPSEQMANHAIDLIRRALAGE